MTWVLPHTESHLRFLTEVEALSGQKILECYQCGKCTAGCPTAFAMDYPPNQILRAIQLGMRDTVLSSKAIWLCASCETCGTRCPQDVDFPRIFELYIDAVIYDDVEIPQAVYIEEGLDSNACNKCGICEERCGKNVAIRKWLKEAHKTLEG